MEIILDNIIFSLQKSGGISVVWKEHLTRLLDDKRFECRLIEYDNAELNFFRKQLSIDSDLIELKKADLLFLERYFNFKGRSSNENFIFHSSYYRFHNAKHALNISTVHDFTYEHYVKGIPKRLHSWQKKNAINNSSGIICISESTKADLLYFYPDIKPQKIKVIYNGVSSEFCQLDDNICFDKQHPYEDYDYVIYVGDRKASYKNFDMAVQACKLVNLPLLIIGGGALQEREVVYLNTILGKEKYTALEKVTISDLNFYYNRAFCLLYPSLYEGFGLPVIEAQRAGCPVIATDSSSIPEVIANKYFAVSNPDPTTISAKMNELFNFSLRQETKELGFVKSKQFSWEKTYNETTQFYNEIYLKSEN